MQPLRLRGAEIQPVPQVFSLGSNYPNPFNSSTTIPYHLATASSVQLDIYEVSGRKVRTLFSERQAPGFYETIWDGRDEDGVIVAAGVYLYRLNGRPYLRKESVGAQREFVEVRKMMLLK